MSCTKGVIEPARGLSHDLEVPAHGIITMGTVGQTASIPDVNSRIRSQQSRM